MNSQTMKTLKNIFIVALLSFPMILTLGFQPTPVRFAEEGETTVIKTVVIDAGHGGKDPGCHGASAHEKDVCLAMALELGKAIQAKYPNIKVVYTRDKDVFVELDERAHIANKANANLFICIHANSASPSAYGTETYVLGLHRTDAQAKIADRENSVIEFESDKEKYKDFDMTPDALILRQLQLSIYLDHSISFAEKLQSEFKSIGRYDRGVRQAGFLVLYKTTMPSVLIETGFLTNGEEEKFLADKDNQKKMAQAMFSAFEKYKKEREGVASQTKGGGTTTTVKTETNGTNTNNSTNTVADNSSNDVYFRVQIETSETKISLTAPKFKGLPVQEYKQDNLFKYTAGDFKNDFKLANNYKTELRSMGFSNAFVVAFQNGERINLEKAIKLAEK
jgi:N-acetylmuramoyl-L-alanine amidase